MREVQDNIARIDRVIDGDSVVATFFLGFGIAVTEKLRLSGINAPERNTEAGQLATDYLKWLIELHSGPDGIITVRTEKNRRGVEKKGKFGRYLATILSWDAEGDEINLNDEMVESGHAKVYA